MKKIYSTASTLGCQKLIRSSSIWASLVPGFKTQTASTMFFTRARRIHRGTLLDRQINDHRSAHSTLLLRGLASKATTLYLPLADLCDMISTTTTRAKIP